MIERAVLAVAGCALALLMSTVAAAAQPETAPHQPVLDETPKVFVVNGYSTSFQWPRILQRKLDRYFGRRVIEVNSATKGGTPIAKWMDAQTGAPLRPWTDVLRPALKAADKRSRIVLAQQSLQWAFGKRGEGIRTSDDRERIEQGADVIQRYAELALRDGAQQIFMAMHIYKHPMEPEIGNERLALAELLKRRITGVHAGPDLWEPTKKLYPKAFAQDLVHPNTLGAEVMAQGWFEALLEHDGLEVPEWSREEMQQAIESEPKPPAPRRGSAPTGNRRPSVEEFFRRNDRNGDGELTKEEFPEGVQRVFDRIDANGDGVVTKEEHTRFRSLRTRR
jgi:hypothetical protein